MRVAGIERCKEGWIAVVLDAGLPATYTTELFQRKTGAVFQHVYERYWGAEQGLYAEVGA